VTKEEFFQYEKTSKDSIDLKRIYVDIAGDLVAGVLLSQIIFYYLPDGEGKTKLRVMHDGELWLAKTREEWWEECRISPKQFDRSIKILEDKQLVTTRTIKFNGSPIKHIRLNFDVLTNQIELFEKIKNDENIDYKKWIKSASSKNKNYDQNSILLNEENGFLPKVKNEINQKAKSNVEKSGFLPKVKNSKNIDEKPILPKEENGFLPKGKIEIDQKAKSITETTNRDYLLPDSVSLSSRSSDNKLVTRSKRSLWNQSVLCSDTKIDNLGTYNTPKDTVCILDNNKRDISLNKALDIEHIKPEISLKVPVIEPDISFKELDRETAKEPVNKPVLSTVTMLEDKTGKILNSNLNKPIPIDELDIEPEMSFDVPDSELDISTIESEEDAYAILVRDGFIDPSDPDDPFRDLLKNMPPHVEYTEEELEEILKKLNAGSSLNASCSEKKSNFERSGKILNNEQNKPKKDLFKPFSFDDFFGTSDNENLKVAPDISQVLANKKQNNTSESETGKNLNSSLNKPEKDIDNASDMSDDTLSEPDNVSVDDSDDDFFKLDDGLFESEEYKEFFAMLDAMPNHAPKASLEMSHSETDRELKTVPNQKPDTSLNALEKEPERNVIMPDADLSELENKPAGMDAEQTLQNNTDLQKCLYAEDTNSFTSAAEKTDCNTDSHVLHVLDKADVNKVQDNQNADSNADLMLHHTTTEQGFESVPEGEEVNYGYGNWNDYSLEETDDDGTIISSGQFVQDCDVFENFNGDWKMFEKYGFTVIDEESDTETQADAQNAPEKDCDNTCDVFLSDDVVKILAKDELSDADIKILEEAGFSVVDEFVDKIQLDAKNVPEKHIDSTEHELVRMLEEAFNAKVIDDVESDIDSVLIVPEKHADSTEQDFVRMLEEAFNARVVDDAESDVDTASDMPEKYVNNTKQELVRMIENTFNAKVIDDVESNILNVANNAKKPDIKPVDKLDTLPESLLRELEKVTDSDKSDKMPVAESGRSFNEPDEVLVAEPDNELVSIADTDIKPEKVYKAKVISLADRRKSLRQADNLEKLPENALDRRQSQIAFVNRHTNALQECSSCKNTDSLTTAAKREKATGISGLKGLELAVNAGMCKWQSISSDSPPSKEIFRNLFAVSKQEHQKLTFACEGGT